MLEKLLPFLNRSKSPSPEEDLPSSESSIVVENLITLNEVPVSVLNGLFIISTLIIVIFISLTFVNQALKSSLDIQKQEQTKLVGDLQGIKDKQDAVLALDRKIKFYQNYLHTKKLLTDKSGFIMDHLNPGLTIKSGEVNEGGFKISLVGQNVYLFTQLIVQYMSGGVVGELSITSANLDPGNGKFTVDFQGVFK
jgi:hypothetical protein